MNTSEAHAVQRPAEESVFKRIAGGLVGEAIGAIAVIALAIVGLAGEFSFTMAAIATIIIGATILIEGGFFAAAFGRAGTGSVVQSLESGDWLKAEFLGGMAAVVLGILALLGVFAPTLLAVAVLVLGASYLLGSAGEFGSGSHAVVGLAAMVLGILAVVGLDQLTLVLVALLALGAMSFYSGASAGARMAARRSGF